MKRLVVIAFIGSVMVMALEIGLRVFDPWGAHIYYSEIDTLKTLYVADPVRGYTLPTGTIEFARSGFYPDGGWTATMTATGRRVPNSAVSDCSIAMVGDSLTFGHAVRDADTFTNILAGQFPGVQFYNLGMDGYNTQQALTTIQTTKADAYVYLLVSNDAQPQIDLNKLTVHTGDLWQAVWQYHWHWVRTQPTNTVLAADEPVYPEWFWQSLDTLSQHANVLMVGFAGETLAETVAQQYPTLHLIPNYHDHISYADGHPNPVGHERIAESIKPYLSVLIQGVCEDSE